MIHGKRERKGGNGEEDKGIRAPQRREKESYVQRDSDRIRTELSGLRGQMSQQTRSKSQQQLLSPCVFVGFDFRIAAVLTAALINSPPSSTASRDYDEQQLRFPPSPPLESSATG